GGAPRGPLAVRHQGSPFHLFGGDRSDAEESLLRLRSLEESRLIERTLPPARRAVSAPRVIERIPAHHERLADPAERGQRKGRQAGRHGCRKLARLPPDPFRDPHAGLYAERDTAAHVAER